jgi:glycosyltransferase involved in cell wall biosynthesis
MKAHPNITVITPVWQGMPYIRECVDSVLAQDLDNWELLISDNCSTDGTREYLKTLSDPRITVYEQEWNLGAIGNLQFLLRKAKAPVCQILNHDDYLQDSKALHRIVDFWNKVPQDVAFASHYLGNMKPNRWNRFARNVLPLIVKPSEADLYFYVFGNIPGNTSEVSVRTGVVEKLGGFREDLQCESDYEFWSRLANTESLGFILPSAVFVREHPGQATHYLNRNGEFIGELVEVLNMLYNRIATNYPESAFSAKLYGTLLLQMHLGIRSILRNNWTFYREVINGMKKADFIAPHPFRWGLYFITLSGRIGRQSLARHFLRRAGVRMATDQHDGPQRRE